MKRIETSIEPSAYAKFEKKSKKEGRSMRAQLKKLILDFITPAPKDPLSSETIKERGYA